MGEPTASGHRTPQQDRIEAALIVDATKSLASLRPAPLDADRFVERNSSNDKAEKDIVMKYLVEGHPTIQVGDAVDAGEGPGPTIAKIIERFHPEAFYGNPTRRQAFMIVDLNTPAEIAELMYVLTWWLKTEPTFTPLMAPEIYGEAIANAKKIIQPQP